MSYNFVLSPACDQRMLYGGPRVGRVQGPAHLCVGVDAPRKREACQRVLWVEHAVARRRVGKLLVGKERPGGVGC